MDDLVCSPARREEIHRVVWIALDDIELMEPFRSKVPLLHMRGAMPQHVESNCDRRSLRKESASWIVMVHLFAAGLD
jgi:hypothetical protein